MDAGASSPDHPGIPARSSEPVCIIAQQARLSTAAFGSKEKRACLRNQHTHFPPGLLHRSSPPLLNAEQVMELLGVSRTALWLRMRTQGLPYNKLGEGRRAALRFSSDSVSRWLATREQQRLSA